MLKILEVPQVFMPTEITPYPRHQIGQGLEYQVENYLKEHKREIQTDRIFLPIKWTQYQISARYGKDKFLMDRLRNFCNSTFGGSCKFFSVNQSSMKKYFTVVQYDDGALCGIINCCFFGAGGIGDIAIPLTTEPHPFSGHVKRHFATFRGSIGTHDIRKQMMEELHEAPLFQIENVATSKQLMQSFVRYTEESVFSLCPRGYGKTSFRLYEAMQLGSVPIYISDEHWLPFTKYLDWNKFCVIIKPDEIKMLPQRLYDLYYSGEWKAMAAEARRVYDEYFCFEACSKMIVKILEEEYRDNHKV